MSRTITLILFALALSGCDMCENTIQKNILSPDGSKKIVIFTRDCGATTAYSSQISILNKQASLPNWFGNTFTSDFSDPVTARWIDPRHVEISYLKGGRVSTAKSSVDGISISYSPK